MTTEKHTPEPWQYRASGSHIEIASDNRMCPVVSWLGFDDSDRSYESHSANAARIVACVNAMAGIPDPAAFVERAMRMESALRDIADNAFLDCGPDGKPRSRTPHQIAEEALKETP